MIFAFNGFAQSDLDTFATMNGLPRFTPTVVGDQLNEPYGETTMDLEVAHAIAPDAKMVVVNARPTVEGDGAFQKIGQMLEDTDRQFPGAIWSLSIGWGCDKLLTAADLAPVRSALADAHENGTTAFNASGDLAGLECKGGDDWDSPPGPADVGLDSIASLPEMTSVGGTTLSTDAQGRWLAEQAWFDVPLSQGTGGGVSTLFDLPPWQQVASGQIPADRNTGKRLTPDISAVADPFTGREDRAQRRQRRRRRNLAVGAHLGGPDRGDDPVPEGQRRRRDRRHQPPAVPHRPGRAAARLPRRDPGRQRRRHRGTGLRPGQRTRHPRRRQPRPQSAHPAEDHPMSTEAGHRRARTPGMVECRVCQTEVPEGEFCGLCGIPLSEHGADGPGMVAGHGLQRLARRASAAAEHRQLAVPPPVPQFAHAVPRRACW